MADDKNQAKGQDEESRDEVKVVPKDPPRGANAMPERGTQVHAQPLRAAAQPPHAPAKDQGREQFETAGRGIRAKPTDVRKDANSMGEPAQGKAPTERRSVPAARDVPDIHDDETDGSDASAPIDDRIERRNRNAQDGDEEFL